MIRIMYVGKKPIAYDNVAGTGKCWEGLGTVHPVTEQQAKVLLKYPDQWALFDERDEQAVSAPSTVSVTNEKGEQLEVTEKALAKPMEHMNKGELVALAKTKFNKDLDPNKSKKFLIDTIEEFERDLEPRKDSLA